MARIETTSSFDGSSYAITAFIEKKLDVRDSHSYISAAIHDIALAYAEEWIIDNLDKIYAQLNVEAIANMIMIEVSKNIADRIRSNENK